MQVARTALMMVLGIVLPLLVQLWDRHRLSSAQRARSWNTASWGAALYAFGPGSMLGWGWVTRPRWIRCLVGPAWLASMLVTLGAVDTACAHALSGRWQPEATDWLMVALGGGVGGAVLLLLMELLVSMREHLRARRAVRLL